MSSAEAHALSRFKSIVKLWKYRLDQQSLAVKDLTKKKDSLSKKLQSIQESYGRCLVRLNELRMTSHYQRLDEFEVHLDVLKKQWLVCFEECKEVELSSLKEIGLLRSLYDKYDTIKNMHIKKEKVLALEKLEDFEGFLSDVVVWHMQNKVK